MRNNAIILVLCFWLVLGFGQALGVEDLERGFDHLDMMKITSSTSDPYESSGVRSIDELYAEYFEVHGKDLDLPSWLSPPLFSVHSFLAIESGDFLVLVNTYPDAMAKMMACFTPEESDRIKNILRDNSSGCQGLYSGCVLRVSFVSINSCMEQRSR